MRVLKPWLYAIALGAVLVAPTVEANGTTELFIAMAAARFFIA